MRKILLIGASGIAVMSGSAVAQSASSPDPTIDRVVVVGSRGEPRLATDTPAPVDVLSGEELASKGYNDLTKVLEFLSPSFNYPRASSGPSSAGARPATLRGLGPDQVLVLINGRRRHGSAILNFNNTVGRGSVPVDYNTIPVSAIERVEVLRDGAAAQYGSDAIAGVINIVLKGQDDGGMASLQVGETDRGQGRTLIARGSKGLPIGEGGFLSVSGEVRDRGDTNAAEIDPRFGRVTSTLGDPATTDAQIVLNAEAPLGEDTAVYGFVTLAQRDSEMSPLFRAPNVSPAFYPSGFLPIVNLDLLDIGANAGVRGTLGGWDWDLSNTLGYSDGDYRVSNSVNTSLGLASPRVFYGGGVRYGQNILNLTVGRPIEVLAGAHLAAGVEHRVEYYKIASGDPASYTLAGAQGFPGFNPPRPVEVDRNALSVFADVEVSLIDGLEVGLAARYEDYSDFGEETTGKASVFWRPVDLVAVRATASTGIRAPSLQQQYFSTVTSQILPSGQLANVGNFAVSDPVSVALGASPLRPEKSTNLSGGIVLTPGGGLSLSVDAYSIEIDDRISLSENIQGAAVTAILQANGINNASVARFFTNAADTTSEGWEATLRWDTTLGENWQLALTASYGSFDTDADRIQVNPVLPQIALLGSASIGILTDAQPRNKALLNAQLGVGDWTFTADAVKFGSVRIPTAIGDQTLEGSTSLDVSIGYQMTDSASVRFGVLNVTDEYPARQLGDTTGRPYTEADPLGFNGREYFLRITTEF